MQFSFCVCFLRGVLLFEVRNIALFMGKNAKIDQTVNMLANSDSMV